MKKIGKYVIVGTIEVDPNENYDHYLVSLDSDDEQFELKLYRDIEFSIDAQNQLLSIFRVISSIDFPMVQKFYDCFAIDDPVRFAYLLVTL